MTIQRAREILGKKADKLTDDEIQDILERLKVIAGIAVDIAVQKKSTVKNSQDQ